MSQHDENSIQSDDSDVISEIDKDEDEEENETEKKNDDTESIHTVKISKEFQEYVVKYVKIDDLIKKKQEEITELKSQKKPCEEYILKYLEKIDEDTIEITNGRLMKNKTEKKVGLNQDIIKASILEKVKDVNMVEEILKTMENKRSMNTKVELKRTGGKIGKKKITKK